MAAEVDSQQQHADMAQTIVLDTTMSESPVTALTASPLPKTPVPPTPTIEEPTSPSDSGSEYSDDFQSPANSRPSSMEQSYMHEDVVDASEAMSETDRRVSDIESRAASTDVANLDGEVTSIEPVATSQGVEVKSTDPLDLERPASEVIEGPASFEDVPLGDEEQTPVEPPIVLLADAMTEARPELEAATAGHQLPSEPMPDDSASDRQPPAIKVSSGPPSPDGSDYSGSPTQSPSSPSISSVPISPMTPQEAHMSIDSIQSIALSVSSLDYDHLSSDQVDDVLSTPRVRGIRHLRKPSSLEILQNTWGPPARQETLFDLSKDEPLDTPLVGPEEEDDDTLMDTTSAWRSESNTSIPTLKRSSASSGSDVEQLDWYALDKTEEQEKEDRDLPAGAEDETTAFLLARLEQENAKFSADPKSATGTAIPKHVARVRSQSRPPSMAHLKKLVSKEGTPNIRYSLAPDVQQQLPLDEPPPMTELEFWAALVQDYPSTATRLPTLTTTKIRAGIPPPLRGVVWASMSGARDKSLDEAFETLQNEKSPYEGIINKDVGRSFPGVELFRDAEGEGQKMLGRVLKCYSLYDKDIGYCQGLGFLVGPLLMNMGEKEAFCVLVR
jgi:hypothetical protein